jgi:hypothetical protein
MHGRDEKYIQKLVEILEEKRSFGRPMRICGVMPKWQNENLWTGLIWLRIGTEGRRL